MTDQPTLTLNDGVRMPQFGLGVWQTPPDQAAEVVKTAVEAGYRSVDTAAVYRNERGVGDGLKTAGAAGQDVFLTTKLWNENQGYDAALKAFDDSLARLGRESVDLYLIHWPSPQRGLYVDSWKALVKLKADGRAKSIGVSNFQAEHLEKIIGETGVVPAVNQVELHPRFQQTALRAAHARHGIATESWSPLGQGQLLSDPQIAAIAEKHGKTPAQVVIRWHLDSGLIVIPKSVTPARIRENIAVFDFSLDAADLAAIAALDSPTGRIGPDPMTATF
ncbi:MAG: aldo/keto reductase [Alphaproteobacteria bacterium]|nr:aldo/keto reductase [Alphaproteobacteria bacterium]MBU1517201.1 aldo/keto reductase [Alphaproteobacteria bacterium]MBU2093263.1 aldo/keto reductase [Alphaproteobacteria bacterium]MBU2150060.1 aldo/keto reductase [Alphaproteobacteria bacterium]MBU2307817.1 aldo/keto reductase [Alphaproteobacteria bacterium]